MKNTIGTIAGVFAFLSIFLWEFSLFPILAVVLGGTGLYKATQEDSSSGMAIWGIIGGTIFLLVNLAH